MDTPRTCIIGAGISGLTAGKMLTDYGIDYTCFESSDRVVAHQLAFLERRLAH